MTSMTNAIIQTLAYMKGQRNGYYQGSMMSAIKQTLPYRKGTNTRHTDIHRAHLTSQYDFITWLQLDYMSVRGTLNCRGLLEALIINMFFAYFIQEAKHIQN